MKKLLKGKVSSNITVTALFKENEEGSFGAVCPEIPGCVVIASSKRDAVKKIKAAIEGCLVELLDHARHKLRATKRSTVGRG